MLVKLLLDRKRAGAELAPEEIRELVAAYTRGDVPDCQMAAFAMAVCCRGMGAAETDALVDAMRRSGAEIEWTGASADKHSTGGVGDKLSLVILPLAASCGVKVPSLAGRGLGLTGGTIDKLEAVPGYNARLTLEAFRRVVETCGVSIATQTAEIAPADRKLYALRDVTGTVSSVPLITASILSKKLAEGAGALVFDVKCGSGAFMATRDGAGELARALVRGARAAGRKACALVTDMDAPLGRMTGNALEVREALDVLRGRADGLRDVVDLSVELAARMVSLALDTPLDAARARCAANLASGAAHERFARMVACHGGDLAAFDKLTFTPAAEVRAPRDGWVRRVDAARVALAAQELGAGRARAEDALDLNAGVEIRAGRGARVRAGDVLARLYGEKNLAAARDHVSAAFELADEAVPAPELVLEILDA